MRYYPTPAQGQSPMPDDPQYRSTHTHRPEEVEVREADATDDDGMMDIRLPVASTGEVRNEGDEPLTRSELRGMARQVDSLTRGVFPEHGESDKIDFAGYSQFEKLGYWADADIEREGATDDEDLLVATARMPDPETLPAATGSYREALAILKEQALRGIPITTSIGWREDEDAPGGNDLLEVSIVGMAADPRTGTEGGEQLVARAAVEAGADAADLLDAVRSAIPEDERPFGPPNGPPDLWDDFDACVEDVKEWEGVDDPEAFCAWAEEQSRGDGGDTEDTHDMSDTDTPPDDDGAGTDTEPDGEQADDGDGTDSRAPGNIDLEDWAGLLAPHLENADASDLMDAWAEFEYVGEVDMAQLGEFVADVTDVSTGEAEEAMADLLDMEEQADDDDDEEDEDDDDEEDDEEDGEQSGDGPDETQADTAELAERIAGLEEDLEAVRSGDVGVETPDVPEDPDGDDGEESRGNDSEDADAQEPRSMRDEILGVK